MLKKLMITTASLALLTSAAIAQAPEQPKQSPPAATTDKSTDKNQVITEQKPDQLLASKVKGSNVMGTNDEKIGDVSDILFDKDQKILAYVVGVGGFLGIGAKDVAIAPASFQPIPGKDATAMKLRLSMTKDELKAAQAFEPYKPPRPVSSDASPTRPMGAPPPGGTPGSIK